MKIEKLSIKSEWKNLQGLTIEFSPLHDITVLIGKNGSAKSNVLEALITIFCDIDLGEVASFSYEIGYELNKCKVAVEAEFGGKPRAKVDGKKIGLDVLKEQWTPRYLVGYYSGMSDRFEELFRRHDRRALAETLVNTSVSDRPEKLEFRRFMCARPEHGLFALLSFYFSNDDEVVDFLKEHPRIEGFDSALLTVRKPVWARKGSTAETFWDAKGPVRDLLERFRNYSLAPITRTVNVPLDFRRKEKRELIHLFLPDIDALRSLSREYGQDPRALFQALDTMRLSGLIEDFRVRVKVNGASGPIHTRQLSEGEQQLLTVLGLMRFTKNEGSLYILDEPDTHLNPKWAAEYLGHLRRIGEIHRNSHTILATHQPLLVAGLVKEEIRVMLRNSKGNISAVMPEESPRGVGVAGVLTSPLYGLESQLDEFSLRVLQRIYQVTNSKKGQRRKRHLQRLRKLVPALETLESSPDPYRNIAQAAYELASKNVIDSGDLSPGIKHSLVQSLASKLFQESIEASK